MDSLARIGDRAPEFDLMDLNGRKHSLRDWLGSIVVLNFWSAECDHSTRADQILEELADEWGDVVRLWCIAANENEDDERIRSVAQRNKVERLLRDHSQKVANIYGAMTTPHVFVIDADGILRYAGGLDDVNLRQRTPTKNYLREAVGAIKQGMNPEPSHTPPFGCAIVRQTI